MSIDVRRIALQGIGIGLGFGALSIAVQGFLPLQQTQIAQPPPPSIGAGGPGSQITRSEWLRRMALRDQARDQALVEKATPADAATAARRKRQRMEEETLAVLSAAIELQG